MVRKISWKKYENEMGYASVLYKTAILLWPHWVVPLYLCWHLFCQQKICICSKWVSVWRLDTKWEVQYLECHTQNHTNMSHTVAALIPHLLKVKYIHIFHMCSSLLNTKSIQMCSQSFQSQWRIKNQKLPTYAQCHTCAGSWLPK